jgi:hypothetical protein
MRFRVTSGLVGYLLLISASPVCLGQQSDHSQTLSITVPKPPADAATVDQFREYLTLTGVGEEWRARWIAAVDMNRSKMPPYWPDSFWSDVKDEMRKTDLAPVIWSSYWKAFSKEMMQQVNDGIRTAGLQTFAASPLGGKFSAAWDSRSKEADEARLLLTQTTLQRVYDRHTSEIKEARAKYIAEHPGYKD